MVTLQKKYYQRCLVYENQTTYCRGYLAFAEILKMKRILFVGGDLPPYYSANSVCALNVAQELSNMGHEIFFLGESDCEKRYKQNLITLYTLTKERKTNLIVHRFNSLINLGQLPNTNINYSKIKLKKIKLLHNIYNFDVIIGVCNPYYNIGAIKEFKNTNKNVKVIGYYLDTIESTTNLSGISRKIRDYLSYRGEISYFKQLDFIIMPCSSRVIYNSRKYENFKHKIKYLNFPSYTPVPSNDTIARTINGASLRLAIIGNLNFSFRNPAMLFNAIHVLSLESDLQLTIDVYGSNSQDHFNLFKNNRNVTVTMHGNVEHSKVIQEIICCDAVLNVSNTGILAVPSKIFELFSTYKPIITYVGSADDTSLEYYKKYPGSFIFYGYEDFRDQVHKMSMFLHNIKNMDINHRQVDDTFKMHTPLSVSRAFCEILKNL